MLPTPDAPAMHGVRAGVDAEVVFIEAQGLFVGILEAAFDLDLFHHHFGFEAQQLLGFEDAPIVDMSLRRRAIN